MDMLGYMRRMARNNLWSNDRLYRAVLALGAGEFEAERTSFFPSIRETLNHILLVDLFYFDMLEERGVGRAVGTRFNPYGEAKDLAEAQLSSTASWSPSATACWMPTSIGGSQRIAARQVSFRSGSATCSPISSCTTSITAGRYMRCCQARRWSHRNSTNSCSTTT